MRIHLGSLFGIALSLAASLAAAKDIAGPGRALGWVGNMYPPGGSSNVISDGASFTIYLQAYKAGVTEPPGQGADVSCTLWWSEVDDFGGPWLSPAATPMSYNVDIGNNDEYMVTVLPPEGLYEFTGYCTDLTDGQETWQGAGNGMLTVAAGGTVNLTRGLWIDEQTIAWSTVHGPDNVSYELHYDFAGELDVPVAAGAGLSLAFDSFLNAGSYPKFPNASGYKALKLAAGDLALVPTILQSEMAIAVYDSGGNILEATGVQIQGVLDDLYSYAGDLGLTWDGGVPTLRVWAPTARAVTLQRYDIPIVTPFNTLFPMTPDPVTGVWSVTGDATWAGKWYEFEVEVFVPETGQVEHNIASDPYAVTLNRDQHLAQIVDLYNDASLKPAGWDTLVKPPLAAPEDITVYELHVRDFSIFDETVAEADRGKYAAFTYDGVVQPLSNGMAHLQALQGAGLTHVHLLPIFDIGSVIEFEDFRMDPDPEELATYPPDSDQQQMLVGETRGEDGFNWGYDPVHYGASEGSYASDPNDGGARILELREAIGALSDSGLRVIMDVTYNHTSSLGQFANSVLDKIVPGYYHRLTPDGFVDSASCCNDTASEFDMMEKLMIDTLVLWARAYRVDGFRFDLMSFHTLENMNRVRAALQALTPAEHGVDGSELYLYGEGWDTGSAKAKGFVHASQFNLAGTGIGTFNDRIRDAVNGGFEADILNMRRQGFANGLSYDWNGYLYPGRELGDLRFAADRLRIGLTGNLQNYLIFDQNDTPVLGKDLAGTGYTLDPQEAIQYVTKHDNETLYDLNVYKAPWGEGGTPLTSMSDRVRMQNMALSLVTLAQGVPFYHAGSDMLRSKSMDSNSFDSGDWFNRLDFSYQANNFGVGLPPAWTSEGRWPYLAPLLADAALQPMQADIVSSVEHLREMLAIRRSSKLFRLETATDVTTRLHFHNMGSGQQDGLIVMSLEDDAATDVDPAHEYVIAFFNANKIARSFTLSELTGLPLALHPVQAASHDPLVQTASFDSGTGTFSIPPRTTAVFVSSVGPGGSGDVSIGFVGEMFPAGGESTGVAAGDPGGLTVYVQVYAAGVTEAAGQGAGIQCFLHWGRYGDPFQDLEMSYNVDVGNNDEYFVTLPSDGLEPGTYGYTAYCTGDGGQSMVYRDLSDGGDGLLTVIPTPVSPPGDAFVHLFEWRWADVAEECAFLGAKGYSAVQVSPPQEHSSIAGGSWSLRYQPLSYQLESRSGTRQEFADMVAACAGHGVDVYVDATLNHMTNAGFTIGGTAGTVYFGGSYDYPGVYGPVDFHYCGTDQGGPLEHDIFDFGSRFELQNCELLGLADIDTGAPGPRATLTAYLQDLVDLGVAGIRADAAKHTAAQDLEALLDDVDGGLYVFSEIADAPAEPVKPYEYLTRGDVTEFELAYAVGRAFLFDPGGGCPGPDLSSLNGFGFGIADTDDAVVFTDNHDIQRDQGPAGDCVVDHQDDDVYDLANVFMLAHPYGYPKVMSSFYWDGIDSTAGPPTDLNGDTLPVYAAGEPAGCNGTDWVCEHRRTAIANMVGFRQAVRSTALTDWWDNGANQIAFGREDRGFVAINRESFDLTRTFQTAMPAGTYCNVVRYDQVGAGCFESGTETPAPPGAMIVVDGAGQIVSQTVASFDAFAIHVAAADTDGDGVADASDNCTAVANPDQRDTNGDGYGNICDPDLDDSLSVNFVDLGLMKAQWLGSDPDADLDGNGAVNFVDLGILKALFLGPPGPSGLAP